MHARHSCRPSLHAPPDVEDVHSDDVAHPFRASLTSHPLPGSDPCVPMTSHLLDKQRTARPAEAPTRNSRRPGSDECLARLDAGAVAATKS
jgi:hypothetical protein